MSNAPCPGAKDRIAEEQCWDFSHADSLDDAAKSGVGIYHENTLRTHSLTVDEREMVCDDEKNAQRMNKSIEKEENEGKAKMLTVKECFLEEREENGNQGKSGLNDNLDTKRAKILWNSNYTSDEGNGDLGIPSFFPLSSERAGMGSAIESHQLIQTSGVQQCDCVCHLMDQRSNTVLGCMGCGSFHAANEDAEIFAQWMSLEDYESGDSSRSEKSTTEKMGNNLNCSSDDIVAAFIKKELQKDDPGPVHIDNNPSNEVQDVDDGHFIVPTGEGGYKRRSSRIRMKKMEEIEKMQKVAKKKHEAFSETSKNNKQHSRPDHHEQTKSSKAAKWEKGKRLKGKKDANKYNNSANASDDGICGRVNGRNSINNQTSQSSKSTRRVKGSCPRKPQRSSKSTSSSSSLSTIGFKDKSFEMMGDVKQHKEYKLCPFPGCDSSGHVNRQFSTHFSLRGCPRHAKSLKRKARSNIKFSVGDLVRTKFRNEMRMATLLSIDTEKDLATIVFQMKNVKITIPISRLKLASTLTKQKNYVRSNDSERPYVCSVVGCGSKYKGPSGLYYHMTSAHPTFCESSPSLLPSTGKHVHKAQMSRPKRNHGSIKVRQQKKFGEKRLGAKDNDGDANSEDSGNNDDNQSISIDLSESNSPVVYVEIPSQSSSKQPSPEI
eukprot:m.32484 g.32484  ORF g.32484 m.32484 type:complete len:661 (+) comp6386_c0_seq4:86-2068(+)